MDDPDFDKFNPTLLREAKLKPKTTSRENSQGSNWSLKYDKNYPGVLPPDLNPKKKLQILKIEQERR